MTTFAIAVLALVFWCVLALPLGLLIGRVIDLGDE
jgi:hypothetical protein